MFFSVLIFTHCQQVLLLLYTGCGLPICLYFGDKMAFPFARINYLQIYLMMKCKQEYMQIKQVYLYFKKTLPLTKTEK